MKRSTSIPRRPSSRHSEGEDGFTLIELLSIVITDVLGMKPSPWSPPQAATAADVKAIRAVLQRRHGGRWNVLFCDGHVVSLTTANLFDTRKASVPMCWNNDNRPDH